MKESILRALGDKSAIIGVVGMGYVGLPLAVETALRGYETRGFDVDAKRVAALNAGKSHILDVSEQEFARVIDNGKLTSFSTFESICACDCIFLCVPTPLDLHQQPDDTYMVSATRYIEPYLKKGAIVILESTTYPGCTEELLQPILENNGKRICGKDFYLAFSAERVDPRNEQYNTRNIPKVVGGVGDDASEIAATLYRSVLDGAIHVVSSPKVAEMSKILENTYRFVNISLANEMALVCNRMGIDVWEVIDAAKTKPYGFQAFYPSPGVGGHCIPLDPFYLSWKAREVGYHMKLTEISGEINAEMPRHVIDRSYRLLNKMGKAMRGARVLVLGLSYKANLGDWRESAAVEVVSLLEKEGADVCYHDPYIQALSKEIDPHVKFSGSYESMPLTVQELEKADLVLILAGHKNVDYDLVSIHAKQIFDTRGAMAHMAKRENIEKL